MSRTALSESKPLPREGVRSRPLGRLSRLTPDKLIFAATALVVAAVVLPPVVTLVRTSVLVGAGPGTTGKLSLASYAAILRDPQFPGLVGSTLVFAAGSTLVGLLLGAVLAWCVERTDTPFKGLAYAGSFVSFAVPGILRTIGWIFLLGPRTGTINNAFQALFHTRRVLLDVFTMPAMMLVEGTFWVPVVFLMLAATFRAMDPSLEEAAVMSGSRLLHTLRRVTFRLALPALLSALLLMFIRAIQAFEVPLVLGVPGKIYLLTTEVYISMQATILPDYSRPSAYGVLLFGFLLGCIYLYSRVTSRASSYVTVTGKGFRPRQLRLRRARLLTGAFVLAVVTVQFLPIIELVFASFVPSLGLSGPFWKQLTTGNYLLVLGSSGIWQSLANSFVIAFVSASVVVLLSAVVAWCLVRGRIPGKALLDQLTSLPLVFAGVVLGLAVLVLYIGSPLRVYGTVWILVIAYVTAFLPFGLRYTHPGLLQIAPDLEESGYVSGAHWATVFRRIILPLLLPALFAAWIFVFLISLRELAAAALLYTAQSPVIATTMLDLWQNGNINQVSAFGSIVSALSIAFALIAYRFARRWGLQA